jgi:peptidoglycan hydrolase-like protein with peptidoglycan-binding domain
MQVKIETDKTEFELMNLQLAESEAERDRFQKEVPNLKSSLTKATCTGLWSQFSVVAAIVLVVASLLATGVFHYALSNVKKNDQPEVSVISAADTGQIVRDKNKTASGKQPPARSGKEKTLFAGAKAASQLQWGPSLVMPEPGASKSHFAYDPLVKQQQENLLALGFDLGEADGFKGARTRQAIAEFRALYLLDSAKQLKDADLAVIMEAYANLARSDAARFGIDQGIVAAIRLSSVRTGVNFSYLMKLAATESNFKPASESATSSATGMYQFTRDTWLNTLRMHGAKYGLVADYAAKIEYYVTRGGYQRPMVREESLYQHLLELRKNPRISAIMTAETVLDNKQELTHLLQREPTETDLYLAHFLGSDKAITFLRSLEQSPGTYAVNLFPEAASSNYDIFHPKTCEPRTIDEVYALFGDKFSTRRYDDFAAN